MKDILCKNDDDEPTTTAQRVLSLFYGCFCCSSRNGSLPSIFVFLFGQFLSLLVTAASANLATLKLDCNLSAPTLIVTPFYICLALGGLIPLYCLQPRQHQRGKGSHKHLTRTGAEQQVQEVQQVQEQHVSSHYKPQQQSHLQKEATLDNTHYAVGFQEEGSSSPTRVVLLFEEEGEDPRKTSKWDRRWRNVVACFCGKNTTTTENTFLRLLPIAHPMYVYFLVAVANFYTNYFTVLAFRYTNITSVALTDALALPTAMILSWLCLGHKYSTLHYVGVIVCLTGILLNVFQDHQTDQTDSTQETNTTTWLAGDASSDEFPHKVWGDFFGLLGGVLYGVSNTVVEYLVSDPNTLETIANLEYLSMTGFFGSVICVVQVALLEADQLHQFLFFLGGGGPSNDDHDDDPFDENTSCTQEKVFGLWTGFSICWLLFYVYSARFLQVSEGKFFKPKSLCLHFHMECSLQNMLY